MHKFESRAKKGHWINLERTQYMDQSLLNIQTLSQSEISNEVGKEIISSENPGGENHVDDEGRREESQKPICLFLFLLCLTPMTRRRNESERQTVKRREREFAQVAGILMERRVRLCARIC